MREFKKFCFNFTPGRSCSLEMKTLRALSLRCWHQRKICLPWEVSALCPFWRLSCDWSRLLLTQPDKKFRLSAETQSQQLRGQWQLAHLPCPFFYIMLLKHILTLLLSHFLCHWKFLERGEEYVKGAQNIKINLCPKNNLTCLYTLILKLKANLFRGEQHDISKI